MSRLIATTADEMLSGTNSNVMGQFWDNEDEVPGVVTLASTNMFPNPDLVEVDERGRLRGWDLDAPPDPDSWNVYMRRITSIAAGNVHNIINNGAPMLRQNESVLRWKEHTYQQDHPLLTDKALPDLGKDQYTDLAPPLDTPRVKVALQTDTIGFPASSAGAMRASYFGILGDHPMSSKRITPAAPSVAVPAIAQGQAIIFYLPDEIPDSWTGIGFVLGPDDTNLRTQKRVDIRGRVLTQVVDKGPYRRDGTKVTPTSTNRTKLGDFESFAKPKHWRSNSDRTLMQDFYSIAYELKTEQGWSGSSLKAVVEVVNDQPGTALSWIPHENALKQPGVQRWRPLFKAKNDDWYTFEDAKENGYPLWKPARLHTRGVGEKWRSSNKAVKNGRNEKDSSGVPAPQDPMEAPVAFGAEQMKPGKYAVRLTTASQKLGMESRPSPRATFTLRDTGVQAGGAPSGVTDQAVRVFRPPGQTIKNSRLVEVDKTDGSTELHWERPVATGITVADSVLRLNIATGTGIVIFRRTDAEPVDVTKFYTLRWRVDFTSWTAGSLQLRLRWLNAAGAEISTTVVEDMGGVQNETIKYTFGPPNGSANYDMPATAVSVQAEVVGANSFRGDVSLSNIGMFVGRSNPRKLWDLVLAEDTPGKDAWPVPDQETHADIKRMHYPAGAYVRLVTSPSRPAQHRGGTIVESKGFEEGTTTGGGWTAPATTGGATIDVQPGYALSGMYGMRADVAAASAAYSAYVWKALTNSGASFGIEGFARIKTLPSTGSVGIMGVTRSTTLTDYLAYAKISSTGAVTMRYQTTTAGVFADSPTIVTASPGDDLKIDFTFANLGTAGTTVTMRVKRNDRTPVSTTALSVLASSQVNRALVGFFDGTTGATARVLLDKVKYYSAGIGEVSDIAGNMVEYWAPEGQPAGNPDHLMTGIRYPVKPATAYVDSVYIAHDGITTPADGADLFSVVSYDADGELLQHHGYIAQDLKGKSHWDRYNLAYVTPANAAYVMYERNRVGDGLIWVMGFQHETGTTPSTWINTNALTGSFQVVFKTTPKNGPKDGDVSFNNRIIRVKAVYSHIITTDGAGNDVALAGSAVNVQTRGADTQAGLATATFGANDVVTVVPSHKWIEVKVTLNAPNSTTSPEVRSVYIDVERDRPVLTRADGRDFDGAIIVYALTPASPVPNVVRKEMADGSVGLENVGRGSPPEKLKLSLQAFTELGKRQAEKNAATDEPLFGVIGNGTRYRVAMSPEFTGNAELEPDGTKYYDYIAEGMEADVISTEDI